MVDYRLQSKTNAPFLTSKLRVTQRNIMVLHSFVGSSPEPIYAILPHLCILYALPIYTIRPTPLYHTPYPVTLYALPLSTIRPTHLYHTPYSFIPHVLLLYTTRSTHLYHTPYSFIPHALPLYTTRPTHLLLYVLPLYTKKE